MSDDVNNRCDRRERERPTEEMRIPSFAAGVISLERASERQARFTEQPEVRPAPAPAANPMDTNETAPKN